MTAKSGKGKRNVSFQAHWLECLNIKNLLVFIAVLGEKLLQNNQS